MGCVGILIIIQPGTTVFKPEALIAVAATLGFAAYNVLTRYVAKRDDPITSFFLDRYRRLYSYLAHWALFLDTHSDTGLGHDDHAVHHGNAGTFAHDHGT
jgi:drug/metabolite transporter (DMT)-like permease